MKYSLIFSSVGLDVPFFLRFFFLFFFSCIGFVLHSPLFFNFSSASVVSMCNRFNRWHFYSISFLIACISKPHLMLFISIAVKISALMQYFHACMLVCMCVCSSTIILKYFFCVPFFFHFAIFISLSVWFGLVVVFICTMRTMHK